MNLLAPEQWIDGGPWWVRYKKLPTTPVSQFLTCYLVSGVSSNCIGVVVGTPAGPTELVCFTSSEAATQLERTRDGVNFEPCFNVEESK